MKKKSLAEVLKPYRGKWVSLSKDKKSVLASGKSLKVVIARLGRMGNPDGVLMPVAKDYSRYAGISDISPN